MCLFLLDYNLYNNKKIIIFKFNFYNSLKYLNHFFIFPSPAIISNNRNS